MAVTLYGFGPALGLPDISPFCTKIDAYLRMAEIPFEAKPGNPRKSPKGKMPYLQHDKVRLSDSTYIIDYLRQTFPNALHKPLTPQQQAIATMTQSAFEEHLYFGLLYFRWQHQDSWDLYKNIISGVLRSAGVPGLVLPLLVKKVRNDVCKALHAQGTGRHTPDEITAKNNEILDATAALLGEQDYFFGEAPQVIDATLFAFLDGIISPPLPSATQHHAHTHANLVAYVERFRKRYYAQ